MRNKKRAAMQQPMRLIPTTSMITDPPFSSLSSEEVESSSSILTTTTCFTHNNNNNNNNNNDEFIRCSVESVENILNYEFINKSLLEAALTHSSYSDSPSYQRLEFVGDAALGLAVANFVFITYPDLDPGQLSLLRAANISTEKLARVAVRHRFFDYVRRNAPALDLKVNEFSMAVQEEGDEILPYGGAVKAPKVLADIVESVAAAVYVDCNFDLKALWQFFSPLLEPIVTLDNLEQQPVTTIYEHCQKEGKEISFKYWKKGTKNITNVFVSGKLMGSASSEQKEISKLTAAKEALYKLSMSQSMQMVANCGTELSNGVEEIRDAKQKLFELCNKKRWPKPIYSVEKEEGPSHDKRFICSVQIELDEIYVANGDSKPKVRDAENSAASSMLHYLKP